MAQLYVNIHTHIYREIYIYTERYVYICTHTHIQDDCIFSKSMFSLLSLSIQREISQRVNRPTTLALLPHKGGTPGCVQASVDLLHPTESSVGLDCVCAVSSFNPEGLRQNEEDRLTYGLDEWMNDLGFTKGHMFPIGGGTSRRRGKKRKRRRVEGRRRH